MQPPSANPCRAQRHPGDTYVAEERVDERDSWMSGSLDACQGASPALGDSMMFHATSAAR
jgi:hypothetical protein